MTEIPDRSAAAPVVEIDANCRRCGYNLRGLPRDGLCPECATPVGLSLRGDLLRFSDPAWVDRVARGLAVLFWGDVGLVAVTVLITCLIRGAGRSAVFGAVVFVAGRVPDYGKWLATTPDPGGVDEVEHGRGRRACRVALLVGIAGAAIGLAGDPRAESREVGLLLLLVSAGTVATAVVEVVTFLGWLARVARRLPDDTLERRSRFLARALGGTLAAFYAAALATRFCTFFGAGWAVRDPSVVVGGVAVLAAMVFGIMFLVLVRRLTRRLHEQAAAARRTWAGGSARP